MNSRLLLILLAAQVVFGQAARDLEGIWSNATITPLERPPELAGKATFTAEEAAAYEKQMVERSNVDHRSGNAETDVASAYNQFWYNRGTKAVGSRRTSLIVDPPDGRVPALTPEAQKRMQHTRAWMEDRILQATSVNGEATRGDIGRATRWWWTPPTSRASFPCAAPMRTCT